MEWTLDKDRLYENPLMTEKGREEIRSLMSKYDVSIPSLTGDCFMQEPFHRTSGNRRDILLGDLKNIVRASSRLGINSVVVPLVDEGTIENGFQEKILKEAFGSVKPLLSVTGVRICFESDFNPKKLADFIDEFEPEYFGISYDIGNSASLGYDPEEETMLYGHRILNVHVKDRLRGGKTVPLGKGEADIPCALRALVRAGYGGNYILQTARAEDGQHVGVLAHYRSQVSEWLEVSEYD